LDFIDTKHISLISSRLKKFKKIKSNLYNFRCPFCGDSERNKNKARGYFYSVKNNTNYKCHNCGLSISFANFLKKVDSNLYKEYCIEKFKEGKTGKNFSTKKPEFKFSKPKFFTKREKSEMLKIPVAAENSDAKKYLESRKLDPYKFYYTPHFKEWTNSLIHTFDDLTQDEERIIIPLFYQQKLIGFQGRSLGFSKVKYITIMLDEDAPKIYGLDDINETKAIYITEGPFDSTFIKNSVAMCGSDIDISSFNWSNYIYIYDNEPRNREIVNRIEKTINRGNKVVIWPSTIQEKDINELVLSGHNVQNLVESNTYFGLEAQLKFTNWKKI
jgi:transcription elongation factor Elf1